MSGLEKEELISRIKGMSEEELEFVVNLIPQDLILNRIAHDLEKLNNVKKCMLMLQKQCGEVIE